jgi:hypothetical protein
MANLGEQLWRSDGKTAALRLITLKYTAQCESRARCTRRASVGVECRDFIGHPIWRKDLCDEHPRPIVARARALGIEVYSHDDPIGTVDFALLVTLAMVAVALGLAVLAWFVPPVVR